MRPRLRVIWEFRAAMWDRCRLLGESDSRRTTQHHATSCAAASCQNSLKNLHLADHSTEQGVRRNLQTKSLETVVGGNESVTRCCRIMYVARHWRIPDFTTYSQRPTPSPAALNATPIRGWVHKEVIITESIGIPPPPCVGHRLDYRTSLVRRCRYSIGVCSVALRRTFLRALIGMK